MINVMLSGHNYEHDVFELIRVFYPEEFINFVPEGSSVMRDMRVSSEYDVNKGAVSTKLYFDKELKSQDDMMVSEFKCHERLNNLEPKLIKSSLYNVLSKYSGKRLPWGMLTGIRPAKLARQIMGTDEDDAVTKLCLEDSFHISSENAELILDIAKRQSPILKKDYSNSYSLYASIPFCPSICKYCAFPTASLGRYSHLVTNYVDRLVEEIALTAELMQGRELNTVYIGGGTPSSIPTGELQRVVSVINEKLGSCSSGEFTVECGRADTISTPLIRMLVENGVNRISINPQSMNDRTLEQIGRTQTEDQVIDAFNLSKRLGVKTINMDLILGLPGENAEDVKRTLNKVGQLRPENLTVHTLALKKGSKLREKKSLANEAVSTPVREMIDISIDFADRKGYHPYYLYRQKNMLGDFENIGYTVEGHDCIYNIMSMEECETIIGIGMGSITKLYYPEENRIERVANFRSVEEYINRFHEQHRKKYAAIKQDERRGDDGN